MTHIKTESLAASSLFASPPRAVRFGVAHPMRLCECVRRSSASVTRDRSPRNWDKKHIRVSSSARLSKCRVTGSREMSLEPRQRRNENNLTAAIAENESRESTAHCSAQQLSPADSRICVDRSDRRLRPLHTSTQCAESVQAAEGDPIKRRNPCRSMSYLIVFAPFPEKRRQKTFVVYSDHAHSETRRTLTRSSLDIALESFARLFFSAFFVAPLAVASAAAAAARPLFPCVRVSQALNRSIRKRFD